MHKKNTLILIVVLVAAAFLVGWLMTREAPPQDEISALESEIENLQVEDLEGELQALEKEIQSL